MDTKVIEQKQLVERFLLGRLTPPEERFFVQLVRKSPELAERMGLPMALKRTMQLLDDTGTEWREEAPRFWHKPWVPAALAGTALLALVLALGAYLGKRAADARFVAERAEAERGLLLAPTAEATLKLAPARPGEHVPTYVIGNRTSPTLAELKIALGAVKASVFTLAIKRDDGTYWARLDNQVKDSNGDLRLGFNSAAFAQGTYEVEVLEVTSLRGDTAPFAKLRLRVE